MKIAFDVHGTLIRPTEEETLAVVEFLKILKRAGHYIIVWSGDDIEQIEPVIKELKIQNFVDLITTKINFKELPDIAFDDNEFAFSNKVTIKV